MTGLLRQPQLVPRLFGAHPGCDDWSGRKAPRARPEPRFQAWSALFDRELAVETHVGPRPSQAFVAVSVLVLLYAIPFLRIADAMLDAAMPR